MVEMVFICKHGLHRTPPYTVFEISSAEYIVLTTQRHSGHRGFLAASPAIVPPSLLFSISLNTEEDVPVYVGSRKHDIARRCQYHAMRWAHYQ